MTSDVPASSDTAVGTRIAGYLLEEQIGRGGMAVVYRALDERLDRRVALKLLAPSLAADTAFQARFMRESRAAAAVDHPNIIPVYDAGDAGGGSLFIVMRYIHGGDARTLLRQAGPLPAARVWRIITQVAAALDAAHARGLIHRDVKPANILLDASTATGADHGLGPDDRSEHVYLADFGISKQTLSSNLTSTGQFVGTLDYIAPEQIEGRDTDGRADQYSLACAAFELLSGIPPFRRDQGIALLYAQLNEPPPTISSRRPGIPAAVDPVLAKALAKSPAERYATCAQFAADLGRALHLLPGEPEAGRPLMPSVTPAAGGTAKPWPATELADPAAGHPDQFLLAETNPGQSVATGAGAGAGAAAAESAGVGLPPAGSAGVTPAGAGPYGGEPASGQGVTPPSGASAAPLGGRGQPEPTALAGQGKGDPTTYAGAGGTAASRGPGGPNQGGWQPHPPPAPGYGAGQPAAPGQAGYATGQPAGYGTGRPAAPGQAGYATGYGTGQPASGYDPGGYATGQPAAPGQGGYGTGQPAGYGTGQPAGYGTGQLGGYETGPMGGYGSGTTSSPVPQRERVSLVTICASIVVVVMAIAAVGVIAYHERLGPFAAAQQSTPSTGPTTPPTSPSTSPPPSLAAREAGAVNSLLTTSAASRQPLQSAVTAVMKCNNLGADVAQIQTVVNQRSTEYNKASALAVGALPNGAVVKNDLRLALLNSLDADKDYLAWAQAQETNGCPSQSSAYSSALTADGQAEQSKTAFVNVWNPIAATYGFPQASASNI